MRLRSLNLGNKQNSVTNEQMAKAVEMMVPILRARGWGYKVRLLSGVGGLLVQPVSAIRTKYLCLALNLSPKHLFLPDLRKTCQSPVLGAPVMNPNLRC